MTLIQTRQAAFGLALILVSVCAVNVLAQKQTRGNTPNEGAVRSNLDRATDESQQSDRITSSGALTAWAETSKHQTGISQTTTPANNSNTAGSNEAAATTGPQAPADKWQFQFTPYLWIAGLSGRAGIGTLTTDVDAGITDTSVHLNFGFMGTFEARKNRLVILTDLQYSDLSTEHTTPGPLFSGARASFKTFVLDPEVGYRVIDNQEKGASVDVLGGFRYWHLRTDLLFNAGVVPTRTASASRDWADGVVGLRGRAHISPRLFVVGKGDLGGGGSKFTYQLFGGVGVTFGKRYALIGGYRHLHVNYNKDNFLFDMSLHGPIFGFGIKF